MDTRKATVIIIYHSYDGPVKRLAEGIAEGARKIPDVSVALKSVEEVSDEDLLGADGIAVGSPKCVGHCISPEIYELFGRLSRLRQQLGNKVGTAFSGSHSSFGGQEIVHQTIFHAMLACNMVVLGQMQPDRGFSDFIGGVIVEQLNEKTSVWAQELGGRLAEVALRLSSNPM